MNFLKGVVAIAFSISSFTAMTTLISKSGRAFNKEDYPLATSIRGIAEETDKSNDKPEDPEATDCTGLLTMFRAGKIDAMKNKGGFNYKKSYATLTNTDKPFYAAMHDKKIDKVRASTFEDGYYYERQLTNRVAEIFDEKSAQGQESIMLDVGGNIGWFSLVAAAHGATKVYTFEPNLQNTVRFCEALSLNRWLHDDRSKDVVIPVNKGASNHNGQEKFYETKPNNPGSFSFAKLRGDAKVMGELDLTTLDSFAERHGWFELKPNIALFKLDVEQYEPEVLEGADKLLKARLIEKIAMELKPKHTVDAKRKIIRSLVDAGYELYMHGNFLGPSQNVTKVYSGWEDLVEDVINETYKENVMFRLRD